MPVRVFAQSSCSTMRATRSTIASCEPGMRSMSMNGRKGSRPPRKSLSMTSGSVEATRWNDTLPNVRLIVCAYPRPASSTLPANSLEVTGLAEVAIDTGEADVGNRIEALQSFHHHLPDSLRGHIALAQRLQPSLDTAHTAFRSLPHRSGACVPRSKPSGAACRARTARADPRSSARSTRAAECVRTS